MTVPSEDIIRSFLTIIAIKDNLNLYQILAPGQFLADQLSFLPLRLAVDLVLLRELGESFVLDHIADLLVSLIRDLLTTLLPLPSSLQEVLKVCMGRRVLAVKSLGSFTLHNLLFELKIFYIFIALRDWSGWSAPPDDVEKLSNWVSAEENHEDARAASQPTNGCSAFQGCFILTSFNAVNGSI